MAIIKRITKGSSLTYQEMDDNLEQIAPRTSATGSIQIPAGATADRDGSPINGYFRYNTSLNQFEGYVNSVWTALGGGGGGGGEANQNAFSNIAVAGQSSIGADSVTDTLNIAAGSNITLATDAGTDTLTINATFSSVAWSSITSTPTTLAGYGITDGQSSLVSGTNIKTVNGQSILGGGDLSVSAGSVAWGDITSKPTTISGFGITDAFDGQFSSLTGKPTSVSGYGITDAQAILVSGSNIKTINGVSVLGSGDLTVTGSYGNSDVDVHLNTSGASTGQVLSWNGIDYAWISGGGGGSETDPIVGAIDGIVKSDGAGNISAAVAGTDYSNFDGDWNSLTNTPTTLADASIVASLLDLTNQNTNTINDGIAGQVLTTDGNGNFSFTTVGSGGSGATSFIGLSDTPNNYTGAANQVVTVNSQGTGLTYTTIVSGAESNDLSSIVTWTTVPDAYISNTSVVQHQSDLRITESQITDLQNYIVNETDPIFSASAVANVVSNVGDGFLRNVGGEWYYDSNTYVTSAAAETDPVFTSHTTYDIVDGTGFLSNSGQGANSWFYDGNTYIQGSDVPENETDPVFSAHTTASINDGTGFLKQDGAGNWFYDANDYITAAGSETDPVFTAHTTYNIANGTGYLKNDGGGTWSYEANNFLTAETDPVFTAHTSSNIVDGEGFLRQDSANNWYFDANTYITANDIPASSLNLDDVTTNGSSTTNSVEVGALTVGGVNVLLETANVSTLTNDANYITLQDLSANGDLTYDNTTGVFSANLQSTGITGSDIIVIQDSPAGSPSLSYNSANLTFVYTPPDLSPYLTSAPAEEDPVFMASGANNITHGTGFLVGDGNGGWYFDSNTYLESSGGGGIQTEEDPVFTAHTTASITDGVGRLVNDGAGNWTYEANTFVETETDPVFTAHTSYNIADGSGFLQNDGAGNWTYATSSGGITLNDLDANTAATGIGSGELSYDSLTGLFTLTPPDLTPYVTSSNPEMNGPTKFFNMTTVARDALTGLTGGEVIFNSTLSKLQVYDGTAWVSLH